MTNKIKIAIVDDHGLIREGIAAMLINVADMKVVASISSGEEAVNLANETPPDVFLMDIMMRGMTGIEATRWIKEQNPAIKIIIISSEVNKDYIRAGIKSGIDGYLPKDTDKKSLLQAIHEVVDNKKHFSSEIIALVFEDFYKKEKGEKGLHSPKSVELSKQEEEFLIMVAKGKSLKAIADELFISMETAEARKLDIQDKLNLNSTAQLVKYAYDQGLVEVARRKNGRGRTKT